MLHQNQDSRKIKLGKQNFDIESISNMVNDEMSQYKNDDSNVIESIPFDQYFESIITSDSLKTLVMDYNIASHILKIQEFKYTMRFSSARTLNYSMSLEAFLDFLETRLSMNKNAQYNDSSSVMMNGVPIRTFAIREPYRKAPLVVISTAKRPPTSIETLNEHTERMLSESLTSNFLICGKTGAGKTYLLNYLLSKYFPKESRLGIIQEFSEIFAPNEYTDMITIPPKKPGQNWNDLEFLTEQSNLMRYDNLLIGEIKGSEAWPFVVNAASGIKCGATIHGEDAQMALQRLRTLCLLARDNLDESVVDSFISKAIQYVIVVKNARVMSIEKVVLANKGKFSLEVIG